MIAFPNCKINLGLHILRKRNDGYHELETVFYPLPLKDVIEIITGDALPAAWQEMKQTITHGIHFFQWGLPVQGDAESNLCIKAYRLLQKDFPQLPAIQLYLYKAIPMGAGLGGGSADAAFTLQLLNEKFQLAIPTNQLINYALQLGSDCPFFIANKPCLATGRGELLQTIPLDLSAYTFVLVNPGIHINTAWAFKQVTPAAPAQSLKEIILLPVEQWKDKLLNDFETPVCNEYPALKSIKKQLYDAGAVYAAMSGSGSAFYGIFQKGKVPANLLSTLPHYMLF